MIYLEKLNIKCDYRAKELISEEIKESISFPFKLLLAYITTRTMKIVLNSKEDLLLCISPSQAGNYIKKKCRDNFKICEID